MSESDHDSGVIGVDIGGANLKYATAGGVARSTHFPMWLHAEKLSEVLAADLKHFDPISRLAVTMTGELADCFVDRSEGVKHIVTHTCRAATQAGAGETAFYGVDGRFRSAQDAIQEVDLVAAANWHALASYVGQFITPSALLIDVGSTTTDIIPIANGRVATSAETDFDRLIEGSLVYVGCRRTPVCALVDRLTYRGQSCRVMNERFATMDDARLVSESTAERMDEVDTADGKPRTIEFAIRRLARMIGLDRRQCSRCDATELAEQIVADGKQRIRQAMDQIGFEDRSIVISGHGQDLIDLPPQHPVLQLSETLGESVARCAPSYALAKLCQ